VGVKLRLLTFKEEHRLGGGWEIYGLESPGLSPGRLKRLFALSVVQTCSGTSLPHDRFVPGFFHGGQVAVAWRLHFSLVTRLRISGAIPPLLIAVATQSEAWLCGSSPAAIVGSNPAEGMDVCCECCMLHGRGLCDGLITRPEDSYRVWCVWVCNEEALVH
jgi:hypothetical protein